MDWLKDETERRLYESTVHGLRSQGWSRIEAENEALERIDKRRHRQPSQETR